LFALFPELVFLVKWLWHGQKEVEGSRLDHFFYDSRSIWNVLLEDIRSGRYKEKLPPETELAAELGISRTQLRDGLSVLEQDGFITRRRGIGTVINRHVVDVKTRLDLEVEFMTMVRLAGYESKMILISVEVRTDIPHIAEILGVSPTTPILTTSRLVTANGDPAIFCIDYISFSIIKNFSYTREDLSLPIFHFLEKFCSTNVVMDLTEVKPLLADEILSEKLKIPVGTPLLYLDEIAYNIDNQPVMYCQEYYKDGVMEHKILRKKI